MTNAKTTTRICEVVNDLDEFRKSVCLQAPALASVLDQLDAGVQPSPLEVMIAISEGVEYLTGSCQVPEDPHQLAGLRPGRLCPAC